MCGRFVAACRRPAGAAATGMVRCRNKEAVDKSNQSSCALLHFPTSRVGKIQASVLTLGLQLPTQAWNGHSMPKSRRWCEGNQNGAAEAHQHHRSRAGCPGRQPCPSDAGPCHPASLSPSRHTCEIPVPSQHPQRSVPCKHACACDALSLCSTAVPTAPAPSLPRLQNVAVTCQQGASRAAWWHCYGTACMQTHVRPRQEQRPHSGTASATHAQNLGAQHAGPTSSTGTGQLPVSCAGSSAADQAPLLPQNQARHRAQLIGTQACIHSTTGTLVKHQPPCPPWLAC